MGGEKTVTEYRIVASDGWVDDGYGSADEAADFAKTYDENGHVEQSGAHTHRVQSRTVTTTEWKDVRVSGRAEREGGYRQALERIESHGSGEAVRIAREALAAVDGETTTTKGSNDGE